MKTRLCNLVDNLRHWSLDSLHTYNCILCITVGNVYTRNLLAGTVLKMILLFNQSSNTIFLCQIYLKW